MSDVTLTYRAARDRLVELSGDYDRAHEEFRWPDVGDEFNWAVDWFDAIAAGNHHRAADLVGLRNRIPCNIGQFRRIFYQP